MPSCQSTELIRDEWRLSCLGTYQRSLELENILCLQNQIRRVPQSSKFPAQLLAQIPLQAPSVVSQNVRCHCQVARFSVFGQPDGPEVRLHAGDTSRARGYTAATTPAGPSWEDVHFCETGKDEARVSVRDRIAVATERGVGTVKDGGGEEIGDVETVVPISKGAWLLLHDVFLFRTID